MGTASSSTALCRCPMTEKRPRRRKAPRSSQGNTTGRRAGCRCDAFFAEHERRCKPNCFLEAPPLERCRESAKHVQQCQHSYYCLRASLGIQCVDASANSVLFPYFSLLHSSSLSLSFAPSLVFIRAFRTHRSRGPSHRCYSALRRPHSR